MRVSVALALVAAVAFPCLAAALTMMEGLGGGMALQWSAAIAAGAFTAVVGWRIRAEGRALSWSSLLLGGALAAVASWASPDAARGIGQLRSPDAIPTYDLLKAPLPVGAQGLVRVRGYLRDEMVLDEYRVAEGDRPDQNQAAPAKLIPLLSTPADEVVRLQPDQRVVVARVGGDTQIGPGPQTVEGVLRSLPSGTFEVLFATTDPAAGASGIMLDSHERPTPETVWTHVALVLGAAVLAVFLLIGAGSTPRSGVE